MELIGIIADDLTGANDSGVQFTKKGFPTMTLLNYDSMEKEYADIASVIVIDTETRELSKTEAYERTGKAAEILIGMGASLIYKKIDSIMRGHPGTELLSAMKMRNVRIGIVTPAFPATKRVVVGGFLFVGDDALKSKYGKGIDVVHLIKNQAGCNVKLLTLKEVRGDTQYLKKYFKELVSGGEETIVVADAVCQEDLKMLARAVMEFMSDIVIAGSGGLAEAIISAPELEKFRRVSCVPRRKTLIVIGSFSKVTSNQVNWFLEKKLADIVTINTSKLAGSESSIEIEGVVNKVKSSLHAGKHTAVILDSLHTSADIPEYKLFNDGEKRKLIIGALMQISRRVIYDSDVGGLVLSGGDTAYAVCEAIECKGMRLRGELEPGIPVASLMGEKCNGIYAVTKSGSFGSVDVFEKILKYMDEIPAQ